MDCEKSAKDILQLVVYLKASWVYYAFIWDDEQTIVRKPTSVEYKTNMEISFHMKKKKDRERQSVCICVNMRDVCFIF